MKRISIILLAALFLFSCAQFNKKPTQESFNKKDYEEKTKPWENAVSQVKSSPLNNKPYEDLILELDNILLTAKPLEDTAIEVNALRDQTKANDIKSDILKNVNKDFAQVKKIFGKNEKKMNENEWFPKLKQDLANASDKLDQTGKAYTAIYRDVKKRLSRSEKTGNNYFKNAKKLRNNQKYNESKEAFKMAVPYNRDFQKSAEDSIQSMTLHEKAIQMLASNANIFDVRDTLTQAANLDQENKNIDKTIKKIVNGYLSNAGYCEKNKNYAAAAVDYWQVSKFYTGSKQKTYEKKVQSSCKLAVRNPMLKLAINTTPKGQYSKDSSVLAQRVTKKINSELKTISLTSKNRADISAEINVTEIKIEQYQEDPVPKSKPYVYCQNCKIIQNPAWVEANDSVETARSAVAAAESMIQIAKIANLNTSFAESQLHHANHILEVATIALQLIPQTKVVDDVRESQWTEVRDVKRAVISLEVVFSDSKGHQISSIPMTGTAEDAGITIIPGIDFERAKIPATKASLKPDSFVKNSAFENAVSNIQNNFINKFGKSEIASIVLEQLPSDTSDRKNKTTAVDMMLRLLIAYPQCSGSYEVRSKLNSMVGECDIEGMLNHVASAK